MGTERERVGRLAVEITEQKSISTIHFSGTYEPINIILMKEMIHALIRNQRYKLILRFAYLKELNHEAYEFLEWAHKEATRFGGAIVLICAPEEPQEICDNLKQKYSFLVFPNFKQAHKYFIEREF